MDGSEYTPTKPYRPSNGTEGMMFTARFCDRCKRDEPARRDDFENGCPIYAATMAYELDDAKYPREWIVNAIGDPYDATARCTAFEHDPTADVLE